jgi:hypothetical protein
MAEPDRLTRYLATIEATDALRRRAGHLADLYAKLPGVEVDDYFISEYRQEDGSSVHTSLWLFNATMIMEARIPEGGDEQIDFVPLRSGVQRLLVEAKDYALAESSPASRMLVRAWFSGDVVAELRASGPNCEALRDLVAKYLLPNVSHQPPD